MNQTDVYVTVIIWPEDETAPPTVALPLGPYPRDDEAGQTRAELWLKDVYGSDDFRHCAPGFTCDPQWAQTVVTQLAHKEYAQKVLALTQDV